MCHVSDLQDIFRARQTLFKFFFQVHCFYFLPLAIVVNVIILLLYMPGYRTLKYADTLFTEAAFLCDSVLLGEGAHFTVPWGYSQLRYNSEFLNENSINDIDLSLLSFALLYILIEAHNDGCDAPQRLLQCSQSARTLSV